jgi:hypothetical protein
MPLLQPKYNVLPLTVAYFRSRFGDQLWWYSIHCAVTDIIMI